MWPREFEITLIYTPADTAMEAYVWRSVWVDTSSNPASEAVL